jgi:uncharacterized membrane protein
MTKPRSKIRNVAKEHKESISKLDKIAVAVTRRVGTMTFFLSILIWTVIWLSWNLLAPQDLKFDPPMSFTFWLFLSNLIQILLMPLIMLGQNLQGAHAERRSENDFEVNLKAEEEIQEILVELKELKEMIRLLSEKVNGKD